MRDETAQFWGYHKGVKAVMKKYHGHQQMQIHSGGGEKMEEKEKKLQEVPVSENKAEEKKNEEKSKLLKEALADYVLARMPKEMAESLSNGKSMGEIMAEWENASLKKENEELKLKLEASEHKPLSLTGEGGERERDPFALGFMQAFNEY